MSHPISNNFLNETNGNVPPRETPGAAIEVANPSTHGNKVFVRNLLRCCKFPNDGIGSTVAQHYNNVDEQGKEVRKQSRIYYMRNFNNWIKSMLIQEYSMKVKHSRPELEKQKTSGYKRRIDGTMKRDGSNTPTSGSTSKFNVLDLGCGKGGDLIKWNKAGVDHLTCVDIAETSVKQARDRYYDLKRKSMGIFDAKFFCQDCTKVRLLDVYPQKLQGENSPIFDIVSCQFAFHYSFESKAQAECMVKNAAESLRPGGYFIGTTIDAEVVWRRLKHIKAIKDSNNIANSPRSRIGNSVYSIEFDKYSPLSSALQQDLKGCDASKLSGKIPDCIPKFGVEYMFQLREVVDCPEFLVNFDALNDIAERNNMILISKQSFENFFKSKRETTDGKILLDKMNALETYSPYKVDDLVGSDIVGNYAAAEAYLEKINSAGPATFDSISKVRPEIEPAMAFSNKYKETLIGTLSKEEWEAITLYCVFAFKKKNINPN